MAYTLVTALAKKKGYGQKWTAATLGSVTIRDIYNQYNGVILTLTSPFINHPIYFDLLANRGLIFDTTKTLNQWLVFNGNITLPTKNVAPSVSETYVNYRDVQRANYNVDRVTPTGSPSSQSIESDRVDILLSRANTDYLDMASKCLVSVNGLIHRTEGSVDGLYVRRGARSSEVANTSIVGIITFSKVADFTIIPITEEMVYKQNDDQHLYQGAYINAGVDLSNKTPILVMAGFLHIADDLYRVVGNKEIFIDMAKMMVPERLFAAGKLMDLGPLLEDMGTSGNSLMSTANLQSDEFITKYLTLSQSFIVLVNTDNLFVEKVMCESTDLVGSFITSEDPIYPLIGPLGKVENYWPMPSFNKHVLHCKANLRTKYRFESTDWWNDTYIENVNELEYPFEYSAGFLMKIGKETLTF
jgi:hypothetical protein